MATIPDVQSMGARALPEVRRAGPANRSGLILADALDQVGQSVNRTTGIIKERKDKFTYATARSALLQGDIEARRSLENDPDWSTYETRYREAMGKARGKAIEMIGDKSDRAMFEMETDLDLERGAGEIRGIARGKEVDWGRSSLEASLAANREAALNAKDETTRSALVRASQEMVEGAVEKGYLKQEEGGATQRRWAADYGEGVLTMLPATEQIAMLGNPKNTPADFIDPAKRAVYLDRAKKEVEQDARMAASEARAARAEAWANHKRSQDVAVDEAQKHLAAGGTLSSLPKNVWRSMDGGDQLRLQAWESAKLNKVEKGRTEDDQAMLIDVQDEIEAGNITDPKALLQFEPYLKDSTLQSLNKTLRKRGTIPAGQVKSAFVERKQKSWAQFSDKDMEEYVRFQEFVADNVKESKRPEDVDVWADRWFMQGSGKKDSIWSNDPDTYGEAMVAGRKDFTIPVPEADRDMVKGAMDLLAGAGYQMSKSPDDFYTSNVLEARRVLDANALESTPERIAAVAYLQKVRQPTTVANIEYVINELVPPAAPKGPSNHR